MGELAQRAFDLLLERLNATHRGGNISLVLGYVPSEHNPADEPSRAPCVNTQCWPTRHVGNEKSHENIGHLSTHVISACTLNRVTIVSQTCFACVAEWALELHHESHC